MLPKTVMQSSIVGDRVAVEIGDGYYAPAIIKSMRTDSSSSESTPECIYTVCFDDGKSKYCSGDEIIGSNFKSITDIKLQPYQKVYTVHKGCEVSGYVLSCDSDKVKIQLPGFTEKEVVERTLNELYLFTNRWDQTTSTSQYNVDNIGGNHPDNMTSSEDRTPTCKDGRAVSASIKVPQSTGRVRKTSEEPTMTELIAAMVLSNLSCSPVFHNPPMLNNPQTNLGTSPQSLDSSGVGSWSSRHISPTRHSNNPTVVVGTAGGGCGGVGGGGVVDHHRLTPSDEPSDDDVNMILIDRSTPTPKSGSKTSQDEMQDEPQDLRVPRVNVVRPSSYKDSGEPMEAKEVGTGASTSQHNTTAPIPFPVVLSNYPYYFPHNVVTHPLATSLPPDFRFQLSPLQPHHPSVMTITSPPPQQRQSDVVGSGVSVTGGSVGHSDGKMSHRHHHRPTPYHKVAEEALISSAGSAGSSPSSSKPVYTQHSQYYPFQSSPVPIASLSFSPTHHVKQHSRSQLAAASPTQRSTLSPSSSQSTAIHKQERTSPLAIPTAAGGYAVYESRGQPTRITPVMGASGPTINIATAKAFSWQNECSPVAFSPKPSIVHQRQQIHQLASPKMGFPMSPKPIQIGRKVRGDGKKCRKVYGMERRDLWCTSCRWKKACQRFPD